MKKSLFTILMYLFINLLSHSQGLENIIVESIPVDSAIAANDPNLSQNAVSYRIFVDMLPGYGLSVITGTLATGDDPDHPMFIKTTTEFYNNSLGSYRGDGVLSAAIPFSPSIIYDSYICVGGAMDDRIGVPLFVDSGGYLIATPPETHNTPGLDYSMFNTTNSSLDFYVEDGSWNGIESGGIKGPEDGDSTIVMIGQFTTDGILTFRLNIQLSNPQGRIDYYVANGQWYKGPFNEPTIQYTPLSGTFGTSITRPQVSVFVPFTDTIPQGVDVTFSANASDIDGTIDSVEFRVNSIKIGVDTSAPYTTSWKSTPGVKTITAVAIDNDTANTTSSPQTLVVGDPNNNPTVSISNPFTGQEFTIGEQLKIEVNAQDDDMQVDSVSFFLDSIYIGLDTSDPYEYNWTIDKRGDSLNLTAVATDNFGAQTTSEAVWIKVIGANSPPQVNIVSPIDSTVLTEGNTTAIIANASDDVSVDSVSFFLNGNKLGVDTASPFQINWDSPALGDYEIIVIATDNENVQASDTIHVRVIANQSPQVTITLPANESIFESGDPVSINADASDTDGAIDSVIFYIEDSVIYIDTSSAYQTSWTTHTTGEISLIVKAVDDKGAYDLDTVTITVIPSANFSIHISAPVEGDELFVFDLDTIKITENDINNKIDSVEFFVNGVKKGLDTNAPYWYLWTPTPTGQTQLIAVATGNLGASTDSDTISVTVKNPVQPTINLVSPVLSDTIIEGDIIQLEADAHDSDGQVDSVEFFINNQKTGTDTSSPFQYNWVSIQGNNTVFKVIATDNDGLVSAPASITIDVLQNTAPDINITSPSADTTYMDGESITIHANASDSDGSIDSVEFFIDSIKIGIDTNAPYHFNWTCVKDSAIKVKAKAFDDKGLTSMDSVEISVSAISNILPVVTITYPYNDSVYIMDTTIMIQAEVTDPDGTIDSVEFYINSLKLSKDISYPFEAEWITTLGSYTISAKAYDNSGETSIESVRIWVTEDGTKNIENNPTSHYINIHPNPFSNELYANFYQINSNNPATYTIYNALGNRIIEGIIQRPSNQTLHIITSTLIKGMYIFELKLNNQKTFRKKIIKK
jgi:hypothetical protein